MDPERLSSKIACILFVLAGTTYVANRYKQNVARDWLLAVLSRCLAARVGQYSQRWGMAILSGRAPVPNFISSGTVWGFLGYRCSRLCSESFRCAGTLLLARGW